MLDIDDLNPAVTEPVLASVNLLNEVTLEYPAALSFGAGRPFDGLFDVEDALRLVMAYADRASAGADVEPADLVNSLGQYGRTKGLIHELIAELLRNDEGIEVDPDTVVITTGAQEAMALCISVLCGKATDVALVCEPGYVGFTGIARLLGVPVESVVIDGRPSLDQVGRKLGHLRDRGLTPRLLYCNPDFTNPSGHRMSLADREALLDLAEEHDLLVLEDSTYRYFAFDDLELPALMRLDRAARVIHSSTFSKTLFPGLRVGYVVADQVVLAKGGRHRLADDLAKAKSMVTNNTSPLCQAIVGGYLLNHGNSIRAVVEPKRAFYRKNRDALLESLRRFFPADEVWTEGVEWSVPNGGFFATLRVPFDVDHHALRESASVHGVIWVPMREFYLDEGGEREIRLAFSSLRPEQIAEGVRRLAAFVRSRATAGGDHDRAAAVGSGA